MHDLAFLKANGLRGLIQAQVAAAGADSATQSLCGQLAAAGATRVAEGATDQFISGVAVPVASTVAELTRNANALSYIIAGINECISIVQSSPGTIADPVISPDPTVRLGAPPHRAKTRTQP
jgi:hypothetical protein